MDIKMLLNDGSTITCKKEVQEIMVIQNGVEYDIKFLCSAPSLRIRKYAVDITGSCTDSTISIETNSPNTILLK